MLGEQQNKGNNIVFGHYPGSVSSCLWMWLCV